MDLPCEVLFTVHSAAPTSRALPFASPWGGRDGRPGLSEVGVQRAELPWRLCAWAALLGRGPTPSQEGAPPPPGHRGRGWEAAGPAVADSSASPRALREVPRLRAGRRCPQAPELTHAAAPRAGLCELTRNRQLRRRRRAGGAPGSRGDIVVLDLAPKPPSPAAMHVRPVGVARVTFSVTSAAGRGSAHEGHGHEGPREVWGASSELIKVSFRSCAHVTFGRGAPLPWGARRHIVTGRKKPGR